MADGTSDVDKGQESRARDSRVLSWVLWQAENAVDQAIDTAMAPLGLSTTLQGTLRLVVEQPGCSTAELARQAEVRPQSTAHAVARLEALGLVTRTPHPVHGRVQQVHATDSGRRLLVRANEVLSAVERELCGDLVPTERDALLAQLDRVRLRAHALRAGTTR